MAPDVAPLRVRLSSNFEEWEPSEVQTKICEMVGGSDVRDVMAVMKHAAGLSGMGSAS